MRSEPEADALVTARDVRVRYTTTRGLGRRRVSIDALFGVTVDVWRGRTLALVGRSGSGKSTLARCLAALERPTGGEIRYGGRDPFALRGPERRAFRRNVQLLLPDVGAALNPGWTAEDLVSEPLDIQRIGSKAERRRRARELMEEVALPAALSGRRAGDLSGGQRQRLGIARSLALEPRLLIFDEAFSGLDRPVQGQILRLLAELRAKLGFGLILISHDLALARHLADDVAVLLDGRIVEHGPAALVLEAPRHPATRELVAAMLPAPRAGRSPEAPWPT